MSDQTNVGGPVLGPSPTSPAAGHGWFASFTGLAFLGATAVLVTLVMPWKMSGYQLTQWLVYGEPTIALRALPSLLTALVVEFPAAESDLLPLFLITLVALNLTFALALWLILRRAGSEALVGFALLALTGVWYLVNTALVPNTDPLMYLPAALGLLLVLLVGSGRRLVPILWLLAALVLYVHPAGLFSAIPILFAAHLLLRSRADWSWHDLALLAGSIAVVGLLVVGGRSLDPARPADADFPAVLAAEIATVQARAEFRINPTAAINQYRSVADIFDMMIYGNKDFYGVGFEGARWHFTIGAFLFFVGKLILLAWFVPLQQWRMALGLWHPWQRLIALGAVSLPLSLVLFGTDYHRWIGFVDWNLTVVLLLLIVQAQRAGRPLVCDGRVLPAIVTVFLVQILTAVAATRIGLA